MDISDIIELSKEIRRTSIILAHKTNSSHTGGALSMADILSVLYSRVLNVTPDSAEDIKRDRLILSKGHCCAALYAVLAEKKFIDKGDLMENYGCNGSSFFTHVSHKLNGVELSTGSLGHGLPVATGMALGLKIRNLDSKVYCIVGDGEIDEGSNWEAIVFAAHHRLDNLCLIIDKNKIQALGATDKVLNMDSLSAKLNAFNWNVLDVDGHNIPQLINAFNQFNENILSPTAIICNTVKGKGVSYMENNNKWHYSAPNKEQLNIALNELK